MRKEVENISANIDKPLPSALFQMPALVRADSSFQNQLRAAAYLQEHDETLGSRVRYALAERVETDPFTR